MATALSQPIHSFTLPDLKLVTSPRTTHLRHLAPSVPTPTVPEANHAFSLPAPVSEQKSVGHSKIPKIVWRFRLPKSSAADGAAGIASAASPVTAAAVAPETTPENKPKKLSFSFSLAKGEIEHDLNIVSGALAEKKRRKQKHFSAALSKEEMEEDFMAIADLKLRKRVEERPKRIHQKRMDLLFPGLHLGSIWERSYKTGNAR